LEAWADAQLAYDGIPGAAMAVVWDQTVLWSRGYGYADRDRKEPATPSTAFRICSISKLFTSVAVMQLRDEGRLRLDDPVTKHLPWFTIKQPFPEARPATLEGLLAHRSGLPREAADVAYWSGPEFPFPTREQIRERISSQEMLYPPETVFQYSNLGLTLAGEIVAEISQQPYADYIRRSILDPLGMEDTSPEISEKDRAGRLATGYGIRRRDGTRTIIPFRETRAVAPAAGFVSTAADLARFASWQLRLLQPGGEEVLSANTLKEMYRVHTVGLDWETPWGLGFGIWRDNGRTFVGHVGSCMGFESELSIEPIARIAVVFMSNAQNADTRLFVRRAYQIVSPAVAAALDSPGSAKPSDPALARYLGWYQSPFGREFHVLSWAGSLALLPLPTADPLGELTKLQQTGNHTFRRVREDGGLGEEIVFEVGRDGGVTRFRRHSNYLTRVR
jgi:CubicO group peptidase (beta-lactamase class C family)